MTSRSPVPDAARAELERRVRDVFGSRLGVPGDKVDLIVRQKLERRRGEAVADVLEQELDLRASRILDVGTGEGEIVASCLARGADAVGVEPDPDAVAVARAVVSAEGHDPERIVEGAGERLPFADASFDAVVCHNVLEHVDDVDATVAELVRVARSGGLLLVSVPNPLFPYEGHYRVPWPPLAPRWLARLWLRRLGRDPTYFLTSVRYVTPWRLARLWRRHSLGVRNLTAETVARGAHENPLYRSRAFRAVALRLSLHPNVTWLLRKPDGPAAARRPVT